MKIGERGRSCRHWRWPCWRLRSLRVNDLIFHGIHSTMTIDEVIDELPCFTVLKLTV
jgi:hypothetical protein